MAMTRPGGLGDADAGACPMQPTTVIDLSQGDEPVVVREGRGDPAQLGLQPHD